MRGVLFWSEHIAVLDMGAWTNVLSTSTVRLPLSSWSWGSRECSHQGRASKHCGAFTSSSSCMCMKYSVRLVSSHFLSTVFLCTFVWLTRDRSSSDCAESMCWVGVGLWVGVLLGGGGGGLCKGALCVRCNFSELRKNPGVSSDSAKGSSTQSKGCMRIVGVLCMLSLVGEGQSVVPCAGLKSSTSSSVSLRSAWQWQGRQLQNTQNKWVTAALVGELGVALTKVMGSCLVSGARTSRLGKTCGIIWVLMGTLLKVGMVWLSKEVLAPLEQSQSCSCWVAHSSHDKMGVAEHPP